VSDEPPISDEDKTKLRALVAQRRWALFGVAVSEVIALALLAAAPVPVPVLLSMVVAAIGLFLANLKQYRYVRASAAPYLEH
jgi:hypothetical protein